MSGSHNTAWLCEALMVSRSGYYDWLRRRREPGRRERENRELGERIREVFEANRRVNARVDLTHICPSRIDPPRGD